MERTLNCVLNSACLLRDTHIHVIKKYASTNKSQLSLGSKIMGDSPFSSSNVSLLSKLSIMRLPYFFSYEKTE